MDVLCVDQFSSLGGAQQCLLDLIPGFQSRNWRVRALVPADGPLGPKLRLLGCGVRTFTAVALSNKHNPFWEFPAYIRTVAPVLRALDSEIGARRPSVLYVNGPRLLPPSAWVARRHRIPLLFHAHNRLLQ